METEEFECGGDCCWCGTCDCEQREQEQKATTLKSAELIGEIEAGKSYLISVDLPTTSPASRYDEVAHNLYENFSHLDPAPHFVVVAKYLMSDETLQIQPLDFLRELRDRISAFIIEEVRSADPIPGTQACCDTDS